MKVVRIGVIGAGVMGERHCRVCTNLPHVEVVGVAELNEERGRLVADRYSTSYFGDLAAMLDKVDGVIVATPTGSHYALAAECLLRGLNVLVEKPMTETISQAEQLVHLAEKGGLMLQVGHIERFNPAFIELKHVMRSMHLIGISVRRLSSFDTSNTDVDVIRDLMIHDLDLVVNSVGLGIAEINAWGRSINTNHIDHAAATICFEHGPIATLAASRVTEQKVRLMEVTAKGAYVEADLLNKSVLIHRRTFPQYLDTENTTQYRQESIIERIHVPMLEPLALELRHFVDCIRDRCPGQVPGSDGLRALKLAEVIAGKVLASFPDGNGSNEGLSHQRAFGAHRSADQEEIIIA
ncbi:MAG: Gfo/Idh/MocA family oxidoreductase [Chloroflexi bacterium]|nr:Gfo/Idh/MocA family oxidoreductase [Chloroflexota bacterium]